jgi:hypothetical protein
LKFAQCRVRLQKFFSHRINHTARSEFFCFLALHKFESFGYTNEGRGI